MNCQECRDHFAELLYTSRGEPLDDKLADAVQEHLGSCPTCAAELRELRQAQSWLDVLSDPPAGEAASRLGLFASRSPVELYARFVRLRRSHDAWRYAAAAAIAAVVVLWAVVFWPRPAATELGPSLAISGASLPSASSPAVNWGQEFQCLAERLEEQDRLLRLLAAEVQGVETRQDTRLFALENQAGRLGKTNDLQALRLAAIQHDVDQMREFITAGKGLAQLRDGSD